MTSLPATGRRTHEPTLPTKIVTAPYFGRMELVVSQGNIQRMFALICSPPRTTAAARRCAALGFAAG